MTIRIQARVVVTEPSTPTTTESAEPGRTSLMPESTFDSLSFSGDVGAMIAGLLLQASKSQREVARLAKHSALDAEQAAQASKLDHMRESAEDKLVAGLTSGICTAASGLAEIGAGCASTESGGAVAGGVARVADANGKIGAAFFTRQSDEAACRQEQDEQVVMRARREIDAATDADKDARELTTKTLEFFKEWTTEKSDSQKAALFRA
jgi:hypothetical protein